MTIHPQTQNPSTAVRVGHHHTKNSATEGVDESAQGRKQETGTRIGDGEYVPNDNKICECLKNEDDEASEQQGKRNCAENAVAVKHGRGSRVCRHTLATFAEVRDSKNTDSLFADKQELIKDNDESKREVAHSTSLCLATSWPETDDVTSARESGTSKLKPDGRTMSEGQLRAKVCEDNRLTPEQQEDLYKVLAKYRIQLTKRPGKCTKFEYGFKIEGSMPPSANARPIPLALRTQVREQIREMLEDGILEESHSAYINPITLVVREGKSVRICLDARRINKQMVADRTKVTPMRELLQKFYGAKYITSLDLSSAFLQVPLEQSSRQ
jgi:hypothetical protein